MTASSFDAVGSILVSFGIFGSAPYSRSVATTSVFPHREAL